MRWLAYAFVAALVAPPAAAQTYDSGAARTVWEGTFSAQATGELTGDLSVRYRIAYSQLMGNPNRAVAATATVGPVVRMDGRAYRLAELPDRVRRQIEPRTLDVTYDVYNGSRRWSRVTHTNVIGFDVPGDPGWGRLFPGVSEDGAKDLYRRGFTLRNVRGTRVTLSGAAALRNHLRDLELAAERERLETERARLEAERARRDAERAEADRLRAAEQQRDADAEQSDPQQTSPGEASSEGRSTTRPPSPAGSASASTQGAGGLTPAQQSEVNYLVRLAREAERQGDPETAQSRYRDAYSISGDDAHLAEAQAVREREAARVERERLDALRRDAERQAVADDLVATGAAIAEDVTSSGGFFMFEVGYDIDSEQPDFGISFGDLETVIVSMSSNALGSMLGGEEFEGDFISYNVSAGTIVKLLGMEEPGFMMAPTVSVFATTLFENTNSPNYDFRNPKDTELGYGVGLGLFTRMSSLTLHLGSAYGLGDRSSMRYYGSVGLIGSF